MFNIEQFKAMSADAQVSEWNRAKAEMKRLCDMESEMRKHIIAEMFDATAIGTQTIEHPSGAKLKAVVKMSYTLSSDTDAVDSVLDGFEDWQAARLVKWKATLSKTEYDRLSPDEQKRLEPILTIKPAAPTLELKLSE
jgi:hypothetical protein